MLGGIEAAEMLTDDLFSDVAHELPRPCIPVRNVTFEIQRVDREIANAVYDEGVLDLEGLPEKGHLLGVLDDVIWVGASWTRLA